MDADLKSMPGIVRNTDHYDSWLLALKPASAHDLKQKLKVMAGGPEDFVRATFYRWYERFPDVCLEAISAPAVVRLAASALLARSDLDAEMAGRTNLSGYSERIRGGGFGALDLASGTELRASLRTDQISTEAFYAKLAGKDELDAGEGRHRQCERLNEAVPGGEFHHRRAGRGSLGRIRVFILAKSDPPVAIEAKRVLRSARSWARRGGHIGPGRPMTGMTTCPRCFWTLAGAGSADQRGGDR